MVQVGMTKDQGLYNKPPAAVHPGALAFGTLPQYNTKNKSLLRKSEYSTRPLSEIMVMLMVVNLFHPPPSSKPNFLRSTLQII